MKCTDCKFRVNFSDIEFDSFDVAHGEGPGAWGVLCAKANYVIINVKDCTGYEKSKHKKIKPI